jgi:hypothetical protein
MAKIAAIALFCVALGACSSGNREVPASGSSTPPAATNTMPNANQGQMHNVETPNPAISNRPTSGY